MRKRYMYRKTEYFKTRNSHQKLSLSAQLTAG